MQNLQYSVTKIILIHRIFHLQIYISIPGMISTKIIIFALILSILSNAQVTKKCCSTYDKSGAICLTCPDATYYYGNNCVPDVDNCAEFVDCFVCGKCVDGFGLVEVEVGGKKVKKCQQVSSYLPIDLTKKTEQGPWYDAYIISDDYMKNSHKELKPAKLLSAYHKSSPNGIQLIKIQYELTQPDSPSKFYRTTMQIDLSKYQFKEVDFAEIDKADLGNIKVEKADGTAVQGKAKLPIETAGGIGETQVNGEYLEKVLDLREPGNLKIVQAIDVVVRGTNLIYKKVVAVKIKSTNNGKQFVEITYLANDDVSHVFLIDATTKRVISVDGQLVNQPIALPASIPSPPPVQQTKTVVNPAPPSPPNPAPASSISGTKSTEPAINKQSAPFAPPVITLAATKPVDLSINKQSPKPISQPNLVVAPVLSQSPPPASPPPMASPPNPSPPPAVPAGPSPPSVAVKPAPSVDPQTEMWGKQSTVGYTKQDNIDLLKDLKFLVAKDLLNKKLVGYQDILPASCYSKTEKDTKTFLMLFNKPQGIQTQTLVRVISQNFASQLLYEHKVGIVDKTPVTSARVYTPKDLAEVTKSSYFIPAAIQVSKAVNGYNSDNLISVSANQDDPNTIYYKSVYNVNGKLYQVESLTKKKLRIGQLISEKDITPPNTVINLIPPKPAPAPKENTETPAETGNTQTPPPAAPVSPPAPPANSNNPDPAPPSPPAQPQQKKTPPPIDTTPKTDPANTEKPAPQQPSESTVKPPKPQTKAPEAPTPKPVQAPPACQFPKATPKFSELLKFSSITELPQSILTQIGGFSQISETSAKSDVNYLKVESFVECTSLKVLKDAQILGAFSKGTGFSSQFKIYYETPKKVVYEIFVTIDRIKSKIYIINFNPISFGVQ